MIDRAKLLATLQTEFPGVVWTEPGSGGRLVGTIGESRSARLSIRFYVYAYNKGENACLSAEGDRILFEGFNILHGIDYEGDVSDCEAVAAWVRGILADELESYEDTVAKLRKGLEKP